MPSTGEPQAETAGAVVVPARPSADLQALIDALAERFDLVPWAPPDPPPGEHLPTLVDVRDPGELEAMQVNENPAHALIAVADEEAIGRLRELDANVLQVVNPQWPARFSVRCIEAALRSWRRLREAYEEDENIIEIQQEVVKSLGDIVKLKQKLASRTEALEERNIELTLKNNELAKLNEFKAGVLGRLGDPDRGYIADILSCTSQISEAGDLAAVKSQAQQLQHLALKVKHIFQPYDFYAKAEEALHGEAIAVAVSGRKARRLLVRALLGTGASVQALEAGEAPAGSGETHILFVDWDCAEIIPRAVEANPDLHVVLLTTKALFESNLDRVKELPLSNLLIADDLGLGETTDPILVQQIVVTAGKLLSGDVFGLEKYLAWGTLIREQVVTSTEQKDDMVKTIGAYAKQHGLRTMNCRNLETLTDELLMNALWDAPTDAEGNAKYAEKDRRLVHDLLPHEAALLRYGSDGNLLGISVSDPFGALARDQAFHYLVKCFAKGEDQVNYGGGGAGLGLFQSFLAVSTFVINVAPGKKTEVIGLLDMNLSRKDLAKKRSYQYFLAPGRAADRST